MGGNADTFTAWPIKVPPGFTYWATRVMKPETVTVVRGDTQQCLAVLGAFVFALKNPELDGTNAALIPERIKAKKRRAAHVH